MKQLKSQEASGPVSDRAVRLVSLAVLVFFATVFLTNWLEHHWDRYKVMSTLGLLHIPRDNPASYYGPIIRRVDQLPTSIHELVCNNSEGMCPADPGQPFSGGDLLIPGLPSSGLIWFRRIANRYILYMSSAGYAGPVKGVTVYTLNYDGTFSLLSSIDIYDLHDGDRNRLAARLSAIGGGLAVTHVVLKTLYEQQLCEGAPEEACERVGWPFR